MHVARETIPASKQAVSPTVLNKAIKLAGISFSYKPARWALGWSGSLFLSFTSFQLQLGACRVQSNMGRGAQPSASLLLFSLGLVLLYFTAGGVVEAQKTWCIAKPSASNEILAQNLDYACSQVSCAVIQKGGPCYYPDSLVSRAAVAMNLYYAYSGRHAWNCYFNNSALVVQSDPSYGSCTYY